MTDTLISKVVRDGMVAVVVSPGYGAGWSTWSFDASPFDPTVVAWIEAGKPYPAPYEYTADEDEEHDIYTGGLRQAVIEWLPVGTRFRIDEYDGHESIHIYRLDEGYVA